jgi:hypothetical protein
MAIKCEELPFILIYDRYTAFLEGLNNFLLAAGYKAIEVTPSVRIALAKLRREHYRYIFIGISPPVSVGKRLALVARRRQPEAKIFCLVSAKDKAAFKDFSENTLIKEYLYSSLLTLM